MRSLNGLDEHMAAGYVFIGRSSSTDDVYTRVIMVVHQGRFLESCSNWGVEWAAAHHVWLQGDREPRVVADILVIW